MQKVYILHVPYDRLDTILDGKFKPNAFNASWFQGKFLFLNASLLFFVCKIMSCSLYFDVFQLEEEDNVGKYLQIQQWNEHNVVLEN